MEDDDRPSGFGGPRLDAARLLGSENLEPYSLDELTARISRLEAEIARTKAHIDKASAHRLAAEAFFKPRPSGPDTQ